MASTIDPSVPADGADVSKLSLRQNFLSAHDEIEALQARLVELFDVKFLLSDQDQVIDVANDPMGPYRFGSGWSQSRTITFVGNPAPGTIFRFSNNSNHDHYLANDGVYDPLDLPILPFRIERGGTVDLICYSGTAKLIKFERAQEQSSARFPPFGGAQFTVLMKNSGNDHDFAWKDIDDVTEAVPDPSADWMMFFKSGVGHRKARGFQTSVRSFGAVGDGVADDTAAIQAAVDAGNVFFPPGEYLVTTVTLPQDRDIELTGLGAVIASTTGAPMFSRMPADQTAAMVSVGHKVIVKGLEFNGNRVAGQVGLRLGATYGSLIEGCHFVQLIDGLDMQFCLMARVEACKATQCDGASFVARRGTWTGADNTNSQSNHTEFAQCRVYCATGSRAGFEIFASSGVTLSNCIVEGAAPVNGVHFDAEGSTVVKTFRMVNFHLETVPSNSGMLLDLSGGHAIIDGVFFQSACLLIDATGSPTASRIYVSNVPWWPSGSTLRHDSARWIFRGDVSALPAIIEPTLWDAANVPYYVYRWDDSEFNSPRDFVIDTHFKFDTDGDRNIGASTSGRPRFVYIEDTLYIRDGVGIQGFRAVDTVLDFGSIAAHSTAELQVAITGTSSTDHVVITPVSTVPAGLTWGGTAGTNVVNVRLANVTSSPIDPASMNFRVVTIDTNFQ